MITRRRFLGSTAAAAALGLLSTRARAQDASAKRFLFVHAEGGWDPLVVFAPMFGAPEIDMEPEAAPTTIAGIPLVDGPGRPAVRAFFERHGASTLVLNGVSTRSVNHETCQVVALTGATSDAGTDWPTLLAADARERFTLPHVVVSGPVFPGPHGVLVSRAEGRLQETLTGDIVRNADVGYEPLPAVPSRVLDRFLARRAAAYASARKDAPHAAEYAEAQRRARALVDAAAEVSFAPGADTAGRARTAVGALADGVCRCASFGTGFLWDTHDDNGPQPALFEGLFRALLDVMDLLARTPGPEGRPLAEDTVVVVSSEMARTPAYNATGGRDHWPFTSTMIVGPGVTGGRAVGGFTDLFAGIGVHPSTGDLDPSRAGVAAAEIGATLLLLGGVDPAEALPGVEPLSGLLA